LGQRIKFLRRTELGRRVRFNGGEEIEEMVVKGCMTTMGLCEPQERG
jgi:hypothetical protein